MRRTSLGQVDNRGTHKRAKDTTLFKLESRNKQELILKLTLLMVKVPPAISSMVNLLSRAYVKLDTSRETDKVFRM